MKTRCCCTQHVITALRRLRQEDHKVKASLGYRMRPCLNNKKTKNQKKKKKKRKRKILKWKTNK
jgi:hypothetical protein